ncbi:MAG: DUF4320 family protein [Clostridiales Family XIII bacterium]|jgi:hypothetical protein|nr:DUF4320 family protein [Clostridiales Family XIII bacterium]
MKKQYKVKAKQLLKSKKGAFLNVYFKFITVVMLILLIMATTSVLIAKFQLDEIAHDVVDVAAETGRIGNPDSSIYEGSPTEKVIENLKKQYPQLGNWDCEWEVDDKKITGDQVIKYNEIVKVIVKGKVHFKLSNWISVDLPVTAIASSSGEVLYERTA